MTKTILIFLLFSISLSGFSQSIVFRSGIHLEVFNIYPINETVKTLVPYSIPTVDILISSKISTNMSFETGIKSITYDNRVSFYLQEYEMGPFWSSEVLYQSFGIPLLLKSTLPIKMPKHKIYVLSGITPTYTIYKTNGVDVLKFGNNDSDIHQEIVQINRVFNRNFNILLNTGIGFSYAYKNVEIGIVAEYYAGLYTVFNSDVIINNLLLETTNNYQVTSKGSFFCINFEIAYPLFKPKNN